MIDDTNSVDCGISGIKIEELPWLHIYYRISIWVARDHFSAVVLQLCFC